jgi:hypothetical protein
MALKLAWVRELFRFRFKEEEIRLLLKALDAMTPLPEELSVEFRDQLIQSDPINIMPYVTSFERIARKEALAEGLEKGLEKGRKEGLVDGWVQALRVLVMVRFADWQPSWNHHFESVTDASRLQHWIRLAGTLDSGEAFLRSIGEVER